MQGIVLAGGFGRRLRSVVADVPKPMAPIGGRPFLDILLSYLATKGFSKVILSIGYQSEVIRSYFEDRDGSVEIVFEQEPTPRGTGGAIAAALKHATGDSVFVFNGDTFLDLELSLICRMWPEDRSPVVVARAVPDTERFGRIRFEGNRILRFVGAGERGPGIVNAGCYLIPTDIFARMRLPEVFSFETEFLAKCPERFLRLFETRGTFIDIGVPADYLKAQSELSTFVRSSSCFVKKRNSAK
jgi:D-glycero-alpha-D-manno-heptose 1-phosphate guanylyltransferase